MNRRAAAAAAIAAALCLTAASCSTGGDRSGSGSGSGGSTTTSDPSMGGPTTSLPLGSGTSPLQEGLRIEVLSSQPDRVSGDDARIRVTPAPGTPASALRVRVNDTDATGSLVAADGHLEGVVRGLVEGNNTITATAGGDEVLQRVRAWPLAGPVISGPHLPLLACSTDDHGLGEALDADCSAAPEITWRYVTTASKVVDLPELRNRPADVALATIDGVDVPLYIRQERGVINRSIYEVSSIDATPGDDDPTGPGWNERFVYRFGGSCGTTYGQGTLAAGTADLDLLQQGYAVATASFNNADVQCNDVLSAETTMMVKERLIEELGVPAFTIGQGDEGGAAQLHLLAQDYPGLVNGIVASNPFPDIVSVWSGVTDCGLLLHYYGTAEGKVLTPAQRRAVNGHATEQTCQSWADTWLGAIDPADGCDPEIPADAIYDAATNRGGLRCTLQDANRNQFGTDPATGWAARPLDNVGVQYGLGAFNDGAIGLDEFVHLNRSIGGYDIDGAITSAREEADPEAVLHAYETGRVAMGGGDLTAVPIIDIDVYDDPTGATADRLRPFSLFERLAADPEDVPGFQIWTETPADHDPGAAVAVMDEWLTALRDDTVGGPIDEVLRRDRPDGAVDDCGPSSPAEDEQPGGAGGTDEPDSADGPCGNRFPISGDPRTAAGAPRSGQILKCEVKPVDPDDYAAELTGSQLDQIRAVFPMGVCDWSGPSVGEMVPANPDRSYEDVPSPSQDA
ncbi:MAG: hypothetical protein JWO77_1662 [Ilumatobacteraceae bacterium]|nr:hypothetical protein [Ilumatobacteraceae bacterium]